MTYQEYINQAVAKLSETSIEALKEAAEKANNDLNLDGSVLDGILAALEEKMSEVEFVEFCDSL